MQGGPFLIPRKIKKLLLPGDKARPLKIKQEVLSLLRGLMILKKKGISQITVVRDSTVIIRHMRYHSIPQDTQLSRLGNRARRLAKSFELIDY